MSEFNIALPNATIKELKILLIQTQSSLEQCLDRANDLPKNKIPCSMKNRITFLKYKEQSIIDELAKRNANIK